MGFPRQASGIQSEEFKAFPLCTLLVERQKTKQTKTNNQSKKCCLANRIAYSYCHLKTIYCILSDSLLLLTIADLEEKFFSQKEEVTVVNKAMLLF